MKFGRFLIPSSHIFYRTQKSAAFVNLRPILPGHVLVMPQRIMATMEEMSDDEYVDLWKTVRTVQSALKEHYQVSAFNVAVQDGVAAGQTVPHVHVHILPRTSGDIEPNDKVYQELEEWAPRPEDKVKKEKKLEVADDSDRVDRTVETMAEEAKSYRKLLEDVSKL